MYICVGEFMKKNILLILIISFIVLLPVKAYENVDNYNPVNPWAPSDKYDGLNTCSDIDVNKIKACGCIPAGIADITSKAYFLLRIIGPILLLIIGGFDMAKAVTSQDEKSIAKSQKKLVNKFVAAAVIFLVPTIIKFAAGLVANNIDDSFKCINILLDGYRI